jgi:hypothetical protein
MKNFNLNNEWLLLGYGDEPLSWCRLFVKF